MSQTSNSQFNFRALVSVLSGFTLAAMAVTGLVMFFAPSCRVARDMSWTVWGYSKEQWTAIHVWFSIAFVIASAFHIYLNWTALCCYFKNKLREGFAFRPEWVIALMICCVIGLGTIYEMTPFSSLLTWKETFKRSEFGGGYRAGRIGRSAFGLSGSAAAGMESGQSCGMENSCQSCEKSQNLIQQPVKKDACIETQVQGPAASAAVFGMGQKTLKQYCAEQGVDLSWAISRLQSKGFKAGQTMTMREIADSASVHPRELRSILNPQ